MVIAMTRPTLDSRGVYQFRRKVPKHLIAVLGKVDWKRSLSTRDPAVALRRARAVSEECAQVGVG